MFGFVFRIGDGVVNSKGSFWEVQKDVSIITNKVWEKRMLGELVILVSLTFIDWPEIKQLGESCERVTFY